MGKVLVSLWILGAALYTVNTVIIVDAVNLLGGSEDKTLAAAQSQISNRAAQPESPSPTPSKLAQQNAAEAAPPKAAAPDNQGAPEVVESEKSETAEARTPVAAQQPETELDTAAKEGGPAIEPQDSNTAQDSGERVTVTRAVNMRAGPTTAAPTLMIQQAGTELQVLSAEDGWIQVINPDTQQTGWIYSRYLNPMTSDRARSLQGGTDDADRAERALTERTDQADADRDEARERAARAERRRYARIDPEPGDEVFGYAPYRKYDPYRRLERHERYGWTTEPRRRGEVFEFFFDDYPGPRW